MIAVQGLVHRLSSFGSHPNAANDVLLNGVDLTLERGETVLLMGRNGSGKTTLARYMAGLLIPIEGTVHIDELQTRHSLELHEVRRRVGLLFQESQEQIIAQTLIEDVAFGLENLALPPEEIQRRAEIALRAVGLEAKAQHTIEVLTPAERQRLALAGLLAMERDYFILDEPDRTADPAGLELLVSLLHRLRSSNKGVLIISHKEFWRHYVDRVIVLDQGKTRAVNGAAPMWRPQLRWPSRAVHISRARSGKKFQLTAENLHFVYAEGDKPTLERFSAQVTEGEFIVITGPEGSGKSTLVELLAGLSEPTSGGYVLWNGTPLSRLRASERVRCVGLVYQEAQQQLLGESVAEEIKLGLQAQNLDHTQSEQRARWACEAVGLDWELMREQPSHLLSGGEQARLAIAAVVALEPQVLILDETLSSLDPAGQAEVLSLLRELHAGGTTVLLVTSEDHARTGTRLWKLDRGRLIYDGPPERESEHA